MRHFPKEKIQKVQVFSKKMFCSFLALDTAPTLDVLVLLKVNGKVVLDRQNSRYH